MEITHEDRIGIFNLMKRDIEKKLKSRYKGNTYGYQSGYMYKCKKCGLVHVVNGRFVNNHRCPDCNSRTELITYYGSWNRFNFTRMKRA